MLGAVLYWHFTCEYGFLAFQVWLLCFISQGYYHLLNLLFRSHADCSVLLDNQYCKKIIKLFGSQTVKFALLI